MANSPPLPHQPLPPLANPPAGFPGGLSLPSGIKVEHPLPPFDPAVQARLDEARRSGKFFIAIVISDPSPDDPGRLTCFQSRSLGFNRDWLLRGWQHICNAIIASGLNPFSAAAQAPAPPAAVETNQSSAPQANE